MRNKLNINGKTALVTGGSQGIGKAIATSLAEYGANIIINYRSDDALALQTSEEIKRLGRDCHLLPCDLSHINSTEEIVRFLSEKKLEVDILVLNASVQFRKPWNEVTEEEFEIQMNTNFRSSLFLIQKLYPAMKAKKWGRIVTIGSVQQVRPHGEMIIYAASKMAQVNMVKSLAPQFAPSGITINNIAPGAIETKRNKDVLKDDDYRAKVEKKIPLGFVGEAWDCASIAQVLCSEGGRYITGQDIYIDGGMSLLT